MICINAQEDAKYLISLSKYNYLSVVLQMPEDSRLPT